jgi:hypothetical protein
MEDSVQFELEALLKLTVAQMKVAGSPVEQV